MQLSVPAYAPSQIIAACSSKIFFFVKCYPTFELFSQLFSLPSTVASLLLKAKSSQIQR